MKSIYLFLALSLILLNANAQTTSPADTTNIKIGDKQIIVIDPTPGGDSTDVAMVPDEDESNSKGALTHWDGIDLGVNVLLNKDNKTTLDAKDQWLDLDYTHSLSWRFNIVEEKIRIYKDYAGIIIGAGLTYNSYGFKQNVNVTSDSTGATTAVADTVRDFNKNKLRASYINIPLMLEFNTSENNNKSFHIAAGVIGGWKMGSVIKQKWDDGDDKNSNRRKSDFNMNPFTFDLTARVGYKNLTVFATYGLTPLFKKDKGPEVYPMTVGLQIVPF
jgi:hypothetical protein